MAVKKSPAPKAAAKPAPKAPAKPAPKPVAKKPAPKAAAKPAPKPVAKKPETKPGRYDVAGRYLGADSPLSLPNGRGMTAVMAAAIQKNPSKYSGYADPSQGTPRYSYPSQETPRYS